MKKYNRVLKPCFIHQEKKAGKNLQIKLPTAKVHVLPPSKSQLIFVKPLKAECLEWPKNAFCKGRKCSKWK